MSNLHYWNYPTEIFCGKDAIDLIADRLKQLKIKKPLLITDPLLRNLPPFQRLEEHLHQNKITYDLFSDINPNPTLNNVEKGVQFIKQHDNDAIIAIGGGSAIDAAKGMLIQSKNSHALSEFKWSTAFEKYSYGSDFPPLNTVPFIVIPTTAGTGSELSQESVLIDDEAHNKQVITHPELLPDMVILDPCLTLDLPKNLTAATGMDALTHHIEAFSSPLYHPMSTGIAMEGVRIIKENITLVYHDAHNLAARENMLAASAMAAVAFQKGLGGVHAIAHPLGGRFNKHHGLLNAILLPYVLVKNRSAIEERISNLMRYLNMKSTNFEDFIEWILELRRTLEIPHTLAEIGLATDVSEWVGKEALADISSSDTNAIPLNAKEYAQIYTQAVKGELKI